MLIDCPIPTDKNKVVVCSSAPTVRGPNTLPRRVPSPVQSQRAVGFSALRVRYPSATGTSLLTLWLGLNLLLLFVALPLLHASLGTEPQHSIGNLPIEQTLLTRQPRKPTSLDGLSSTAATVPLQANHQSPIPTQSVEATDGSNRFIVRFGTNWGREVVDLRQGPTQDSVRYRNRRQPQTPETREPIPLLADTIHLLSKRRLRDDALLAGWLPLLARGHCFKHPNDDDPPDERTPIGNQSFLVGAWRVAS
jgi:hypothetical protein